MQNDKNPKGKRGSLSSSFSSNDGKKKLYDFCEIFEPIVDSDKNHTPSDAFLKQYTAKASQLRDLASEYQIFDTDYKCVFISLVMDYTNDLNLKNVDHVIRVTAEAVKKHMNENIGKTFDSDELREIISAKIYYYFHPNKHQDTYRKWD